MRYNQTKERRVAATDERRENNNGASHGFKKFVVSRL
jgi:hypothetical protein